MGKRPGFRKMARDAAGRPHGGDGPESRGGGGGGAESPRLGQFRDKGQVRRGDARRRVDVTGVVPLSTLLCSDGRVCKGFVFSTLALVLTGTLRN